MSSDASEAIQAFGACRLLCLPCAGGSATVYARWSQAAPSWLAVRPVELPGRGTRHHEPLQHDPHRLADQLTEECLARHVGAGTRFALFGHSLGGLLAFEIAHRLHAQGYTPAALFVAASRPPATRDDSRYAALVDDADVLAEMRALGGTPEALLAEPELMAMVLPVIKADFQLCGHYRRASSEKRAPLPLPIHAMAGRRDSFAPEVLDDWRCETRGAYTRTDFEGDHFFVRDDPAQLLAVVANKLAPAMHAPPAVAVAVAAAQ
ncbi:thioesterase II family protein [Pandoraea anhela]|uniref:Linear gramicidin dehydrogenase LgrE n=1 Tax=Pandoraea anhela TaxID=2508295 RepID=A0A5E4WNJ9_9BURK|nr:alpha/beta fold hydrolase [Pandoraea anhela]VVE25190.1 Linear gramicidin dehydrogenase LgrE [Pandoraea anhela]